MRRIVQVSCTGEYSRAAKAREKNKRDGSLIKDGVFEQFDERELVSQIPKNSTINHREHTEKLSYK